MSKPIMWTWTPHGYLPCLWELSPGESAILFGQPRRVGGRALRKKRLRKKFDKYWRHTKA